MKKLLYTTTAFVLCGGIVQANAACIATPSCTSMGYTSTSSCTNGIKCPFGNYWNCDLSNKITELTNKITEQTNKINEIEQKVVVNQSQGEVCVRGSILYSDKSCYLNPQKGKIPIGIVVYIDGAGGGQALALKSIGSYKWTSKYVDISGLTNYDSVSDASKDYDSCGNTAKIIAAGDKSKYPAAWAAHEYKTAGTQAGDWCLPAAGILNSYYNNQDAINTGFSRAGGTKFTTSTYDWSSSESNSNRAWSSYFSNSYGLDDYYYGGDGNKDFSYEVRPVVGFCNDAENYVYDQATDSCVKPAEFEQCNGYAAQCSLGDIVFSDGTCSANTVSGKTPIAVVVYKSDDGKCGQALALNSIGNYAWGGYGTDISTLTNYGSSSTASEDYDSCGNTEKILAAGNKSKYPAAWAAHEYSTEGTSAGDWCLPAAGIFTSVYNNQTAINLGFEKVGGTTFTTSTYAWSSSEYRNDYAWYSNFSYSYGLYSNYGSYSTKGSSREVRPVLAF